MDTHLSHHIAYFSATGNTHSAVERIADTLRRAGDQIRLTSIHAHTVPDPRPGERLLIAFPVHAWLPPAFVVRYLRRLPRAREGMPPATVAIVAVDGGGGFGAPYASARIVRRRGWSVSIVASVSFPENWLQVLPGPSADQIATEYERGIAQTDTFTREYRRVAGGAPGATRDLVSRCGPRWAYALTTVIGWLFLVAGRRLLGKLFVADDDCTACGLCARICPVGAVSLVGSARRPFWNLRCASCNRCVNACPTHAIVSSFPRVVLLGSFVTILCVAMLVAFFRFVAPYYVDAPAVVRAVLNTLGVAFALTLGHVAGAGWLDRAIAHPLLSSRAGRRLRRGFTKSYEQYWVKGFRPVAVGSMEHGRGGAADGNRTVS